MPIRLSPTPQSSPYVEQLLAQPVDAFGRGAQNAQFAAQLANALATGFAGYQEGKREEAQSAELAQMLAASGASQDPRIAMGPVPATGEVSGVSVEGAYAPPTRAQRLDFLLPAMLGSQHRGTRSLGQELAFQEALKEPPETFKVVQNPLGRGGVGQMDSSGRLWNYQGAPELPGPSETKTINVGKEEWQVEWDRSNQAWVPMMIDGEAIKAPRWHEEDGVKTMEIKKGENIITYRLDGKEMTEIARSPRWQPKTPEYRTYQEGDENVTVRIAPDGAGGFTEAEISRGPKFKPPNAGDPIIKQWEVGHEIITSQWDGEKWEEVGRAPRWAVKAHNTRTIIDGKEFIEQQFDPETEEWLEIGRGDRWQPLKPSERQIVIQQLMARGKTQAEAEDIANKQIVTVTDPLSGQSYAFNKATNATTLIGLAVSEEADVEEEIAPEDTIFSDLQFGGSSYLTSVAAGIPLFGKPLAEWAAETAPQLGFEDPEKVLQARQRQQLLQPLIIAAFAQNPERPPVVEQSRILDYLPKQGFWESDFAAQQKLTVMYSLIDIQLRADKAVADDPSAGRQMRRKAEARAEAMRRALDLMGKPPKKLNEETIKLMSFEDLVNIVNNKELFDSFSTDTLTHIWKKLEAR